MLTATELELLPFITHWRNDSGVLFLGEKHTRTCLSVKHWLLRKKRLEAAPLRLGSSHWSCCLPFEPATLTGGSVHISWLGDRPWHIDSSIDQPCTWKCGDTRWFSEFKLKVAEGSLIRPLRIWMGSMQLLDIHMTSHRFNSIQWRPFCTSIWAAKQMDK